MIQRLVFAQVGGVVGVGVLAGLAGSVATSRLVRSLLLPARWPARLDPVRALRDE